MIAYPLMKLIDSIGGLTQQLPAEGRVVSSGEVDQERTGRVSSGKLVSDILSEKRSWSVKYSLIDGDVLQNLILLRRSNNNLIMQYQELYSGAVEEITVRIVSPIGRTRLLATGVGMYEDVSIEIEEV